jgi:hypothetical protein
VAVAVDRLTLQILVLLVVRAVVVQRHLQALALLQAVLRHKVILVVQLVMVMLAVVVVVGLHLMKLQQAVAVARVQ